MTVTFGIPSAEHVTITAGTPLSSTGRISAGSLVMRRVQLSAGGDQPGPGAGAGSLQVDLTHVEFDGQGRRSG